jgi:hypothetical protein
LLFSRKVYYIAEDNPSVQTTEKLRAMVSDECGPDAGLLFPHGDRTKYKPNWWLACLMDSARLAGGGDNVDENSLAGSHASVTGVVFLDVASALPARPFTITVKGCDGSNSGSRPCKIIVDFYVKCFRRQRNSENTGRFLEVI